MARTWIKWIDLARAVAILTVIYIHATDGIYIISSGAISNLSIYSRVFEFISIFIGRMGVPLFLMITGYLLLDRIYDNDRIRKFWKKGWNLVVVTIVWSAVYVIFLRLVLVFSSSINLMEVGELFFSHMWYMPMIIGMYISIPFVASALKNFDKKIIFNGVIVFSILAFLVPFVTLICDMHGIKGVTIDYCLGFSGGVYGIYIILGYLVKKGQFKNVSTNIFRLVLFISCVVSILFQYYAFIKGYKFLLWYDFPFVLFGSFSLFELISRKDNIKCYKLVRVLAKYSFAVFLIHNLFRLPLLPLIVKLPFAEPVKAVILWILLIIFSYITAFIIYRIPKVGKYILYMK